jgi:transcriptional regulator with XRE-family HTH domain
MGQETGRRAKSDPDKHDSRDGVLDDPKSFNAAVGEAIRRVRHERGWTQAILAANAGLSPNYIARLERGELGPSLFVAARICDALGVEVGALAEPSASATRKTGTRRRALAG